MVAAVCVVLTSEVGGSRPGCKGTGCQLLLASGGGTKDGGDTTSEGGTPPAAAGGRREGSCSGRGCASFRAEATCQCNAECVMRGDCCEDFHLRCQRTDPGRSAGVEPTSRVLAEFWGASGVLFVCVALLLVWYAGSVGGSTEAVARKKSLSVSSILGNKEAPQLDFSISVGYFGMHFVDPALEERWRQADRPRRLQIGAETLLFALLVHTLWEVYMEPSRQSIPCRVTVYWVSVSRFVFLTLMIATSVYCVARPSERLFMPLLAATWFYVPLSLLPPLGISCYDLKVRCLGFTQTNPVLREAYAHCDCSLQGQGAIQTLLTMLFLQPWLAVNLSYVHVLWVWVSCVYLGMTLLYRHLTQEDVFEESEIAYAVVLVCLALAIATKSRHQHEYNAREVFVEDLRQRESARKIFCILEYMMPPHVIGPLLRNPQGSIAETIGCVSILFIVIADFDTFTTSMTPSQLLNFLNEQFTAMDRLCETHEVTKIETVGEEYVIAVGVSPDDVAVNEEQGHTALVARIFCVGSAILRCQSSTVKYKMGVHTGPIVAGVIGTKLPRYRLFGDTINSAARMMQKGVPGILQFSSETYSHLPLQMQMHSEGPKLVEMKGKGKVETYTYVPSDASTSFESAAHSVANGSSSSSVRGRVERRGSVSRVLDIGRRLARKSSANAPPPAPEDAVRDEAMEKRLSDAWATADQRAGRCRWSRFCILSEREEFTEEMEEEWRTRFHLEAIWRNMGVRFGRFCICFCLLTAFELWYLIEWRVWHWPHMIYNRHYRWIIFVWCRAIILFISLSWWYCADATKWVKRYPRVTQVSLFITGLIVTLLMYISYDALSFSHTNAAVHLNQNDLRARKDQTTTLNFFIFFCVFMRMHQLPFWYALGFLPFVAMILGIHTWFHLLFPHMTFKGQPVEPPFTDEALVLMLMQVVINIAVAHEVEQSSRGHYKAQHAVKLTEERTTYILDTLMPPLVAEEMCAFPTSTFRSHKYRHATIAQSDLCGFTQLACTKKPTEVVRFMSDLFGSFDKLTDKHGVYKVETVGDAYIAGMAEKPLTPTNSPVAVVLFGLDMVRAVDLWAKGMGVQVTCRVGIHYGECIGGIVGSDMQRYHLFGDLLTYLEILESTSAEGRVQVSSACKLEVERQLRDEPTASSEELNFEQRSISCLCTSKGERHEFSEVGGPTYLTMSNLPLRFL